MIDRIVQPGEHIGLGHYPQTADGAVMPIEWRVLEVDTEGRRALVLSEYVLDMRPYHDTEAPVYWSQSSLHDWLQHDFIQTAFTEQEAARILFPQGGSPDPSADVLMWQLFGMEDATSGIRDAVFLLSQADIRRFFPCEDSMFCPGASAEATPWVLSRYSEQSNWMGDHPCTWLRSSMAGTAAAYIVSPCDSVGVTFFQGQQLNGVRPAMWIRMDQE